MSPRTLGLLIAAFWLGGCDGGSDGSTVEVALADLSCASLDASRGIWESASFPESTTCGSAGGPTCCAWIELDGKSTLRLEHGLGVVPRMVSGYISFGEYGVSSTLASGDALRLESVDDTHVVLLNNTQQRFFLRVALQ